MRSEEIEARAYEDDKSRILPKGKGKPWWTVSRFLV